MSFDWLSGVDPLWGTVSVTLLYLAVLAYAMTRSRQQLAEGAPDGRRWRDLRLWIAPLVLLQLGLYWWLR